MNFSLILVLVEMPCFALMITCKIIFKKLTFLLFHDTIAEKKNVIVDMQLQVFSDWLKLVSLQIKSIDTIDT